MDYRMLKFPNVVDEYSRVCLVIRVALRCRAVDLIKTIEELLKLDPLPTQLRLDNGPEFIPSHFRCGTQAAVAARRSRAMITLGESIPGSTHQSVQR